MFDFLASATGATAFPAGHCAIQFIRHAGKVASFEGLPTGQLELATRIVAEIEAREGKSAAEIPDAKVDEYINLISERIQELSRKELHADQTKGQKLLDALRLRR